MLNYAELLAKTLWMAPESRCHYERLHYNTEGLGHTKNYKNCRNYRNECSSSTKFMPFTMSKEKI